MENAKIEVIRKIQNAGEVYTILSRATNQPFVICDKETFNDQVWIFENKEDVEKEAKPLIEKKNPIAVIRVENKSFINFYAALYTVGVNSVVFFEKDRKTELELEEIIKKPDFSTLPEEKRPLFNPQLQMSGIYFMQELRRGVDMKEKENLPELEEEVAANLVKSRYLLAVQNKNEGSEGKDVKVPYIQNKEGDIFQPIFTDPEEFRKFNKEKKFSAFVVTFADLEKALIPTAKGAVINPQGINLIMPKDKIPAMRQRFGV